MCCNTGECFRVDTDTSNLTDEEVGANQYEVEKADRAELESFNLEGVFALTHANSATQRPIDAVWVRKRKWVDGKLVFKSRLCIRGFLDPQKHCLPTRYSTASRLSQRLLLSISALCGFTVESWDVGTAFLKGFNFGELVEALRKRGIAMPDRAVFLSPPLNVWRHFREMSIVS
jgi:hypothetical protein